MPNDDWAYRAQTPAVHFPICPCKGQWQLQSFPFRDLTKPQNGGCGWAFMSDPPKQSSRGRVISKGFMENCFQRDQAMRQEEQGKGWAGSQRGISRHSKSIARHHHRHSAVGPTPRVLSWLRCEVFPKGLQMALFGEAVGPLGKLSHCGWALRFYNTDPLPIYSLFLSCSWHHAFPTISLGLFFFFLVRSPSLPTPPPCPATNKACGNCLKQEEMRWFYCRRICAIIFHLSALPRAFWG